MKHITHNKFKRRNETKRWLAVFAIIILFNTLLISCLLSQSIQPRSFATQSWSDPLEICFTPWAQRPANGAEVLQMAFENADFPVFQVFVRKLVGTCSYSDEYISYNHTEINVVISVAPDVLESHESVGNLLAEALHIIQSVELENSVPHLDMLRITLVGGDEQSFRWSMNYAEALRVVEAGLSAEDLYSLGVR